MVGSVMTDVDHSKIRSVLARSHERRELLLRIERTDLLNRRAAVDACRSNVFAPAWTSFEHPTGDRMEILLNEEVSRQLYLFGGYEEELSGFLVSRLGSGDVFIDAGAHFGYFSLLASTLVGPTGTVVAFEPNPAGFDMLSRNLRHKANVRLEQGALWDDNGTIRLNTGGVAWSAFTSVTDFRLPAGQNDHVTHKLDAACFTLDSYCATHNIAPNFIKIDVESAESQVLRGAAQIIARQRPVLTVEVGDFTHLVERGVPRSAEILEALTDLGYRLVELGIDGERDHVLKQWYEYQTIAALPS